MILEVILFLAGIALLIKGADLFVGGGSGLAARFGVTPAIIGFTVIAFGTSLPEFVVSVNAVIANDAGIALGNVLGSNIANIALVLALCAFIRPALVSSGMANLRETALMLAATGVFCLCALRGVLDIPAGLLMLATFAAILFVMTRGGEMARHGEIRSHGRRDILLTIGGLAAVVIGSQLVIDGAVAIAGFFNIPTFVIGLSIVAVGTSLPELATSIVAIIKGEDAISVGNLLGSNIFNLLFVMGIAALIRPVPMGALTDTLIVAAFSVAVIPLFLGSDRWTRLWAVGLLAAYAAYIAFIFGMI